MVVPGGYFPVVDGVIVECSGVVGGGGLVCDYLWWWCGGAEVYVVGDGVGGVGVSAGPT